MFSVSQTPSLKHDGGSIMLWGCYNYSAGGPGWVVKVDRKRNMTNDRKVLHLQNNDVSVTEWPSQSPDLNSLEGL